ncbi:MAG: sulfatase-like hydrolase/transferase [Persicimonas sp.]
MTMTFIKGALYGLVFLATWLLVEGVWVAVEWTEVPAWAVPFNLGLAAPLVLMGSVLIGVVLAAWQAVGGGIDPVEAVTSFARRWLLDGTNAQRARRSAALIAAPVLVGVWLGVAVVVGGPVLSTVKTTAFAMLLIAAVQLGAAVALALGSSLLVAPIAWIFDRLGRRLTGEPPRPIYTLAALAVAGVIGFVAMWFAFPDVLPHLPWSFALGPLLGLAAVVVVVRFFGARQPTRALGAALTLLVLILGLSTIYMPQSLSEARQIFVDKTSVSGALYRQLHNRLDYDEDGAIHLYGQNDCAPYDASIGPSQREIIGNGIDENCSGADLEVDLDAFNTGKLEHPRPDGISKRPHIVLVTTDALSHQHTTVGGYKRDTTPNLAEWAERATVFDSAFSLSSSTRLSMPGIVTGKFNSMVEMKNKRIHPYDYAKSVTTMGKVLKEQGYRTVHIAGDNYFLKKRWAGYTHGFDVVDESVYKNAKDKDFTAPDLTDAALEHIDRHKDGDKPLFLWLHYYDHHGPYKVPQDDPPFEPKKDVDRYDNELHFADSHWGRLFDAIEDAWSPEEYMVVFTSDHGEAFDKKHPKGRRHDFTLDTQVLHVPFIVQGPAQRGTRVDGMITPADILPTVANLAGHKPDDEWIGESLVPVLFDGKPVEKDVIYSLFYIPEAVKRGEDGFWKIGVRSKDFAYWEDLRKGNRKFVDWRNDPHEDHDLREESPDAFETYRYIAAKKLEWLRERERALTKWRKDKKKKKKKSKKKAKN